MDQALLIIFVKQGKTLILIINLIRVLECCVVGA